MKVVSVEDVEVGPERIEALVRVDPSRLRTRSAPGLAEKVMALLPGLARHTCENDAGKPFVVELADTETAHLLEHVTCEIMALAGSPRSLRAQTAWDFARDGAGVFRLAFDYDDDLVAVGALNHAAKVLGWIYDGGQTPDIARGVADLRELRLK